MAFDTKAVFAHAILNMCETKSVEKITVKELLEATGFSRKAFYNHFADKYALIHYCYETYICPQWYCDAGDVEELRRWNTEWLENMIKYKRFMKSACSSYEANSLSHYILTKDRSDDIAWYQKLSDKKLPEDTLLFIDYHAGSTRYIIIEWIMNDMPIPIDKLLNMIDTNRNVLYNLLSQEISDR